MKAIAFSVAVLILTISSSEYRHSALASITSQREMDLGTTRKWYQLEQGAEELMISTGPPVQSSNIVVDSLGRKQIISSTPLEEGQYGENPVGVDCFVTPLDLPGLRPGDRALIATTSFESVRIFARGFPENQRATAGLWVEKLARLSLAKYAADRRVRAGSSQSVNGRSLAGFTAQKSNVNFVRFADWATARGIQYTYDSAKCTISFTRNGKSVLLPIAAKEVRVNGTWRDLPDIVMISADRDERTLVPVALDALTN